MTCNTAIFASDPSLSFLLREGEMRARIREFDWSRTELGCPSAWSTSLKMAVSIMLDCAVPVYIALGPRFIQLYNDAYIPILGEVKHPKALGITTAETWHEIWDFVETQFTAVMQSNRAVSMQHKLLPMLRNGFLEECYFTFSYSPLADETGQVIGVFVTVWETTTEFVHKRRDHVARMHLENLSNAADMHGAYAAFEKTVLECAQDLPFGLWYETKPDRSGMELVAAAGIQRGSPLSPERLDPEDDGFYKGLMDLTTPVRFTQPLPNGVLRWARDSLPMAEPTQVCIMPLCDVQCRRPNGYIVLAVNPMRPNDDTQADFHEALRSRLEDTVRRVNRFDIEKREREHQFHTVMEVLPCMVWMSDTEKSYIFFNRTWLAFRGRSLAQEAGTGWMQGIHPDDIETIERAQANIDQRIAFTTEYRLLDARGTYRWVLDEATPRYDMNGEFLGYIGTCFDISERKRTEENMMASQRELRSLYERLQSAREEERCALAREVHDQLGQILSAAKIDIKLLEDDFASEASIMSQQAVLQELRSARHTIDRSIQVVRRLATELRPPELESQGLVAAIEWHTRDFERRTKIRCKLDARLDVHQLSDAGTIALFRIFQEAMTNILRHSNASRVHIIIDSRGNRARLHVMDNGVGIALAEVRSKKSIGLKGMRERATIVGGKLIVGALKTCGTLVAATVPLAENGNHYSQAATLGALRGGQT
ncbi:PAS domain S-box protein [Herbaspirillum sp. GCM10030257]|uniref:sensor histidine kinase n=1 Tax=Herbaspirillum sp. GCM10030257 TaxID=3273393 RepID=UPI00362044E9